MMGISRLDQDKPVSMAVTGQQYEDSPLPSWQSSQNSLDRTAQDRRTIRGQPPTVMAEQPEQPCQDSPTQKDRTVVPEQLEQDGQSERGQDNKDRTA